MPLSRLFYHIVWATKERVSLIEAKHHDLLQGQIRSSAQEFRSLIHAVGIMPDHVHVVASIPPSIVISKVVGRMKGLTSRHLNEFMQADTGVSFAWQAEYSVMSLGEKALAEVVAYANNQPARHAAYRLWLGLERTDDSRYVSKRTDTS
jgi:putative transposase